MRARRLVEARGDPDRVSDGSAVRLVDVQHEAHRRQAAHSDRSWLLVPLAAGLEALLDHDAQPLAERIDER